MSKMKDKISVGEVVMLVNANIIRIDEARDLLRQLEIIPDERVKPHSNQGTFGGQGGGTSRGYNVPTGSSQGYLDLPADKEAR